MNELYIQEYRSRKGCLRLVILVVLVVAAGATVWLARRPATDAPVPPDAAPTPAADMVSVPAAAERAPAASTTPASKPAVATPTVRVTPALPAAPVAADDKGRVALNQAKALVAGGEILKARDICYQVMSQTRDPVVIASAESLLGDINIDLVFYPYPMPEKLEYVVRRGDSLDSIARKFGITRELVAKGNSIKGALIHEGDRFRIFQGKFSVVVDKSDFTLVLSMNGRFFKRYRVGTGKFGKTPDGQFKIVDRISQPPWWRSDGKQIPYGDPENVLGTHWLALDARGYGIHGTWEPETIGKAESAGCIRMQNPDIEELFNLVPIGTAVTIRE